LLKEWVVQIEFSFNSFNLEVKNCFGVSKKNFPNVSKLFLEFLNYLNKNFNWVIFLNIAL
jgi:hypothetical protein